MVQQKSYGKLGLVFILLMSGLTVFSLINFSPVYRTLLFLCGFGLTFIGMLGLRHYWPTNWGSAPVLLLAVIARCFLFPLAPSDDINRYLWEGKCQLHSVNPCIVSPLDMQTEPLRDRIWQNINHKEFTTIYGPVAQLVFKASAFLWYSPFMLKIVIVAFDLGTLLLLMHFLKKRKSRINEALLYAVNPLVLFSFAGEGHMESIMLCMLAGAFLMHQKKSFGRMFIFLGSACFVKLTAFVFLPLFVRKDTLRHVPWVLLPALLAIPFGWSGMMSLFDVTARFAKEFSFNGLLFGILAQLFSNQAALFICTGAFLCIYVWNVFLTPDPVKAGAHIALGFLLTSPTAQPWYFTIIALYLVLYPTRSWIVLTGTIGISWLVIFHYWCTEIWIERFYFFIIEYVPPFVQEIVGRFRKPEFISPGYGIPHSVSVVIPTLNEGNRLRECLASITVPDDMQSEIIVVDGGSTDATCTIAQSDTRVNLVRSEKGRGVQIAEGVRSGSGDVIIIVHADTRLFPDAIMRICQFCARHPHLCGGSVGAKFSTSGFRFAFITFLNNFRSRCTGISFGDQVQFFRRAALKDSLPRVTLMEDIEISMLLKERGIVAVLPCLAESSTRRWEKKKYALNFIIVIALTVSYFFRRRCGLLKGDNSDYYRKYYGKA